MARDLYVGDGGSIADLAVSAVQWRNKFEVAHLDKIDVIAILEFKIPQMWFGFHLKVVPNAGCTFNAKFIPSEKTLLIRKDIYYSALDGGNDARFILAHEIGHIVLHRRFENERLQDTDQESYDENVAGLNARTSSEDQATIFGRFLLAPPKTALKFCNDKHALAYVTGLPTHEAATAITLSKRRELHSTR